jgi:hypothetical protein
MLGKSRITFFFFNFMFSYLNPFIYDRAVCRSQFKLVIQVQNLSQTATNFRKKWHIWELHRIIVNNKI